MDEVLFHQLNKGQQIAGEGIRPADSFEGAEQRRVKLGEHLTHDQPFLEFVDLKTVATGSVLTQEALAEAVKGRYPGLAVFILQSLVDTARDLARSAFREGQDEDLAATGQALTHGLLVQVDQGMRLASARSSEHPQWSGYLMDVEWQWFP
jgi:hypothetical protein